jgi:ABC-type phosphate transport system substrate-binding protein
MPAHTIRLGSRPRRSPHPATWGAAVAIALLTAACTSTTSPGTAASVVAAASPGGHAPTLTGAGSTFDAPFFSVAFARYQQQHPGVTIGYSAVGSSAGITAFSARQVDFGASDVRAATVGTGKTLRWPVGEGSEGNGGVAAAVNRTSFSIGYVEQAYSQGLLLPFAAIRNQAGNYVAPSTQTVAADAAQKPDITPADFSIVNQPGAASYPISGYSWALIYTRQHNQTTGQALVTMLDWLTHYGQAFAAANGYVPLPAQIRQLARTMLQQITGPTGAHLLS